MNVSCIRCERFRRTRGRRASDVFGRWCANDLRVDVDTDRHIVPHVYVVKIVELAIGFEKVPQAAIPYPV